MQNVFLAPQWVHDVIRCTLMQKIFSISGNVIAAKCMYLVHVQSCTWFVNQNHGFLSKSMPTKTAFNSVLFMLRNNLNNKRNVSK